MINTGGIKGLDELIDAFMDLPIEAMDYLKIASDEAGAIVLVKAKQKVPVKTGNLKSKLKLTKAKRSDKRPYFIASRISTSKGASYLVPLELGHKLVRNGKTIGTVKERPFLRPAADESKEEVAAIMTAALNKAIDKMGGLK